MELAWFRRPGDGDEGTTNLTYNAVDLPVIKGRSTDTAVTGAHEFSYAGLLEQVGALAGAMRGLGVLPGHHVGVQLADPARELLVLLAAARVGATCVVLTGGRLEEFAPHLVVTDTELDFTGHVPQAVIVNGLEPADEARDLAWDIAIKAGRTDPAGCEPVSPRATAYVVDGLVAVGDALADPSRFGTALSALVSGTVLTLGDPA
ncbi:AMP-binding protein [Nocardioides jensenii]|uniref:AMP-binding protein n=1 Tax=Nocardioides jensenii TaxID=1843 RepID=UPI0008325F62|nr:AMP-binding protein [Nocardioides jensenii]